MLHLLGYHNSLLQFNLKTKPVWRFYVAGNNRTYLWLHIKCPNSTKCGMSRYTFREVINIKFHANPSSGNRAGICGQMDEGTYGRMDERMDERMEENNESNTRFFYNTARQITVFPTHSQFPHCVSFPLCHACAENLLLLGILITVIWRLEGKKNLIKLNSNTVAV